MSASVTSENRLEPDDPRSVRLKSGRESSERNRGSLSIDGNGSFNSFMSWLAALDVESKTSTELLSPVESSSDTSWPTFFSVPSNGVLNRLEPPGGASKMLELLGVGLCETRRTSDPPVPGPDFRVKMCESSSWVFVGAGDLDMMFEGGTSSQPDAGAMGSP